MAVTVQVNAVDVTSKHKTDGFSIKSTGNAGYAVATVDFVDEAGTAVINLEHILRILDGATEIFEGPIRFREREAVADPGIAKKTYHVAAQDYTSFLADDVVDAALVRTGSRTDKAEVEFLVTTYGTKGITVGTTVQSTGTISRDIEYTGMNLYEALEEASKWLGTSFYVDSNLVLHWYVTESNAAPFNLSDNPNNTTTFGYRRLKTTDDSAEYANCVFVVGDGITGWRPASPPSGATRRAITLRDTNVKTAGQLASAGDAAIAKYAVRGPISLETLRPGLIAGMTIQLTNALWAISAVTYRIQEVETVYNQGTNSLIYRLKLADRDIDLSSLFTESGRQTGVVGVSAATTEGIVVDLSAGGGNLVGNSSFEDGSVWTVGANWVIGYTPTAGELAFAGIKTARFDVSALTVGNLDSPFIPVARLDDYFFSVWHFIRTRTSGTLRISFLEYNAASALLATTSIDLTAVDTDWTRAIMHFGPNAQLGRTAFQATTTKVVLRFNSAGAAATMKADLDGVQLERGGLLTAYAPAPYELFAGAITSTMISDLAVTTPKLAANAVTAGKIAALTITAAEIAAGAITTSKLAAGAITLFDQYGQTSLTPGGFSGPWRDFISDRLYNSYFGQGIVGALSNGLNANLPNWTLSRTGSPTINYVSSPATGWPNGHYVELAATAAGDAMKLDSDLVPVTAGETIAIRALYAVSGGSWTTPLPTFDFWLSFYDVDGTLIDVGTTYSATVPSSVGAAAGYGPAVWNSRPYVVPREARFALVHIRASSMVGASTFCRLRLGGASIKQVGSAGQQISAWANGVDPFAAMAATQSLSVDDARLYSVTVTSTMVVGGIAIRNMDATLVRTWQAALYVDTGDWTSSYVRKLPGTEVIDSWTASGESTRFVAFRDPVALEPGNYWLLLHNPSTLRNLTIKCTGNPLGLVLGLAIVGSGIGTAAPPDTINVSAWGTTGVGPAVWLNSLMFGRYMG